MFQLYMIKGQQHQMPSSLPDKQRAQPVTLTYITSVALPSHPTSESIYNRGCFVVAIGFTGSVSAYAN